MSKSLFAVAILFVSAGANAALADGISATTTCESAAASISGGSTCTEGVPFSQEGYGTATASANAAPGYFFGTASIKVSSSAVNGSNPANNAPQGGLGIATATVQLTLSDKLPLQPGYLIITPSPIDWSFFTTEAMQVTESLSVGNFSESCTEFSGGSAGCAPNGFGNPFSLTKSFTVPFEIGQSYTFDFTATATAEDGDYDYPSGGFSGTVSYQIISAPEPNSLGMVAIALCVLLVGGLLLRRTKRLHPPEIAKRAKT
ncbi:MAG: hypothetical protein JO051_10670 [Acidobacteriaceae bacterium]|nr:hypothetical protein [Acidobacteriaceae bacterium]